ncbi:MAG: hypothetical protein ACLRSW_07850 [Christensenellaceae bacterium]
MCWRSAWRRRCSSQSVHLSAAFENVRVNMEIYGIYQSFVLIFATAYGVSNIGGRNLFTALAIGGGVWLVLFILQGVGLA